MHINQLQIFGIAKLIIGSVFINKVSNSETINIRIFIRSYKKD